MFIMSLFCTMMNFFLDRKTNMITDRDDRHTQYAQRRGETIRENENKNT